MMTTTTNKKERKKKKRSHKLSPPPPPSLPPPEVAPQPGQEPAGRGPPRRELGLLGEECPGRHQRLLRLVQEVDVVAQYLDGLQERRQALHILQEAEGLQPLIWPGPEVVLQVAGDDALKGPLRHLVPEAGDLLDLAAQQQALQDGRHQQAAPGLHGLEGGPVVPRPGEGVQAAPPQLFHGGGPGVPEGLAQGHGLQRRGLEEERELLQVPPALGPHRGGVRHHLVGGVAGVEEQRPGVFGHDRGDPLGDAHDHVRHQQGLGGGVEEGRLAEAPNLVLAEQGPHHAVVELGSERRRGGILGELLDLPEAKAKP
mmetsp:Transcript_6464/g.11633  ORF Transcript_6464/g.11633 Transcript_6464/m.11633 type:complete len:313 (-) Transcript_6464:644-1582(-)